MILMFSASRVARITGVSHWLLASFPFSSSSSSSSSSSFFFFFSLSPSLPPFLSLPLSPLSLMGLGFELRASYLLGRV
jgi:hypothetical protein